MKDSDNKERFNYYLAQNGLIAALQCWWKQKWDEEKKAQEKGKTRHLVTEKIPLT